MIGCHSSCQKYIDWTAERAVEKEKENKQKIVRGRVTDSQYYEGMRRLYNKQKGR
jgi:hypothetical protein